MDPLLSDVLFGILAVILGTVATLALYWLLNKLVQLLPLKTQDKVKSLGFLIPAATLLILVLLLPLLQTFVWSFMDDKAKAFVGLENYTTLFTSPDFLSILLNNFLWILFVPAVTVSLGILFANLGNQVGPTREKILKSLIFMPMTISFVSASTIWGYLYANPAPGRPKIGLLSAVVEFFGGTPQNWLQLDNGRLNTFLLMAVIVWLQVGYSMVIISAGIKAVPEETIEAARIDGANGVQVFFRIIVPQISSTIMSVFVTVLILVMKVFDIVLAMTGGNFNTNVLAFEYYKQFFVNSNLGPASAVVTILLILIAPLMWLQIRTVRRQESFR
jgi:alpha-glucoside transport system permease protein